MRMCIICNDHCTWIKHLKRKNGYYGNPPDYWCWCLCMHLYCLLLCFEKVSQHAFFYDSNFSTKENSKCCGTIIDNRSYATICVLEEKCIKIKAAMHNMLSKLFDGKWIVEFLFKVAAHDYPQHIMDLYLLLYWNLTQ